jgi:hypothetical protein
VEPTPHTEVPVHRRIAALFFFLSLAAAPAWAGDKLTVHVSATILARNTCTLGTGADLRCSGTDEKVLYRMSRASAPARAVLASAARGKAHPLRTPAGRDVLTIEF